MTVNRKGGLAIVGQIAAQILFQSIANAVQ